MLKVTDNCAMFRYIVQKGEATEEDPIVLGNVKFWESKPVKLHGKEYGFGDIAYDVPTSQWDTQAVIEDANKALQLVWRDFVEYMNKQSATTEYVENER